MADKDKTKYSYTVTTESEQFITVEEDENDSAILKIYNQGQLDTELNFPDIKELLQFIITVLKGMEYEQGNQEDVQEES